MAEPPWFSFVGAYLSLSLTLSMPSYLFMDRFVAFLAVHTLLFCSLAVFDPSLHWSSVGWAEGRSALNKPLDYRWLLLYFVYPIVALILSLVLGCVVIPELFERGAYRA